MAGTLSSINILYLRIVFLLTIAFYCFKDINVLIDNTYVLILSQAMNLPVLTMSKYNGQLGLFAFLFASLALTDVVPILENNQKYLNSIVPFRLLMLSLIHI